MSKQVLTPLIVILSIVNFTFFGIHYIQQHKYKVYFEKYNIDEQEASIQRQAELNIAWEKSAKEYINEGQKALITINTKSQNIQDFQAKSEKKLNELSSELKRLEDKIKKLKAKTL